MSHSERPSTGPAVTDIPAAFRVPEDLTLVSTRGETHNDTPVTVRRHERGDRVNHGREHVTTVTADGTGTLLGFTRLQATEDGTALPTPDEAERIAYELFAGLDPAYAAGLSTQWVDRHDETVTDAAGVERTVAGIKVKTRHTDGRYAWIIVGENGGVVTYERDIHWDPAEPRRITAMWLHDRWILGHDGLAEPLAAPAARV